MSAFSSVEKSLEGAFKGAPKLPEKARETIASWSPWICLVLGVLGLMTAWSLWHRAHVTNGLANYVNQLSVTYGGGTVIQDRLTLMVWLNLALLVVESVIYLMAFSPLKARQRRGWDLLFYAVALNAVVGLVNVFTDYGSSNSIIGYVIGTIIGLYFLFQLKPKFTK